MIETSAPLVDPRAAALLCRWAVRYSAGRGTGIYTYAISLAHHLLDHLTASERDALAVEIERARQISVRKDSSGSMLANPGETDEWAGLLDALVARHGDGSGEPVDVGIGRMLALCAGSAARRVTGYDYSSDEPDADTHQQVAQAIGQVAWQFSPADRVLIMRDLYRHHDEQLRWDKQGLGEPWRELYVQLAGMELHDDSRRWERLPDVLGDTPSSS